jgi:glycosyltransferase involved in cell wall biosynthesis
MLDQNYRPLRILFANNYDMRGAIAAYKQGIYPGHHLWGALQLRDYGFNVGTLPFRKLTSEKKLLEKLKRWSTIDQQVVASLCNKYDMVYSGSLDAVKTLALMRGVQLWPRPIVSIVHHPIPDARLQSLKYGGLFDELEGLVWRLILKGTDRLVCLSKKVAESIAGPYPELEERTAVVDWGPDLSFYPYEPRRGDLVVSAGKTDRDYDTLCEALKAIQIPTKIFCSVDSGPGRVDLPWVDVVQGGYKKNVVSYRELRAWYSCAMMIAIPLKDVDGLTGLTSLLDAMAMGKPVVITRNSCLDIDVEKEGCGIWVEPRDVDGWQSALNYIVDNPREAAAMGQRGRILCEKRYNIENFVEQLVRIIGSL